MGIVLLIVPYEPRVRTEKQINRFKRAASSLGKEAKDDSNPNIVEWPKDIEGLISEFADNEREPQGAATDTDTPTSSKEAVAVCAKSYGEDLSSIDEADNHLEDAQREREERLRIVLVWLSCRLLLC